MSEPNHEAMSDEELVAVYRTLAQKRGEGGPPTIVNPLAETLEAITGVLATRGDACLGKLAALTADANPWVRLCAATACLGLDEPRFKAIIEAIEREPSRDVAATATIFMIENYPDRMQAHRAAAEEFLKRNFPPPGS